LPSSIARMVRRTWPWITSPSPTRSAWSRMAVLRVARTSWHADGLVRPPGQQAAGAQPAVPFCARRVAVEVQVVPMPFVSRRSEFNEGRAALSSGSCLP
jgi:hypothetical protein